MEEDELIKPKKKKKKEKKFDISISDEEDQLPPPVHSPGRSERHQGKELGEGNDELSPQLLLALHQGAEVFSDGAPGTLPVAPVDRAVKVKRGIRADPDRALGFPW